MEYWNDMRRTVYVLVTMIWCLCSIPNSRKNESKCQNTSNTHVIIRRIPLNITWYLYVDLTRQKMIDKTSHLHTKAPCFTRPLRSAFYVLIMTSEWIMECMTGIGEFHESTWNVISVTSDINAIPNFYHLDCNNLFEIMIWINNHMFMCMFNFPWDKITHSSLNSVGV